MKATFVWLAFGYVFLAPALLDATALRGLPPAIFVAASDRHLAWIVSIMFLVGAWIAYGELRKWWKTHPERYGSPPLANLLRFVSSPGKPQRAAQYSPQIVDSDRPKKAA
jgi:hypothetical protein